MSRLFIVAAAATTAAAVAIGTAAPASSTTETLYYGKTSQGLGVSIPVKGTQIARDTRAYPLWKMIRTASGALEFHPGQLAAMSFRGGSLAYHKLAKLPGGTIEVWFQARLARSGKTMTGTFRERDVGYSPKPKDTGTISFVAAAWSSQIGVAWAGKTADAKPFAATMRHRLVPGHVIFNGKRQPDSQYTLAIPATTRQFTCQASNGTSRKITASLPALSADLTGSDDLANSFSKSGGLSGSTSGSATAAGIAVKADLTVKRLAWQGSGLAATGTLAYQGTLTTETETAACARTTTTFTLRPR